MAEPLSRSLPYYLQSSSHVHEINSQSLASSAPIAAASNDQQSHTQLPLSLIISAINQLSQSPIAKMLLYQQQRNAQYLGQYSNHQQNQMVAACQSEDFSALYRDRNSNHDQNQSKSQAGVQQRHRQKGLMEFLEESRQAAIRFMNAHNFDVTDRNGQRISTNRALTDEPNEPYSEVFIGKIPRNLFEDELLPTLLQVGGQIKKIRLMMDFSGYNRGFAFVQYTTTSDAAHACKLLDGRLLRPDHPPMGSRISFDNKCLFFGNLPPRCGSDQFVKALRKVNIEGIVGARMADEDAPSAPVGRYPQRGGGGPHHHHLPHQAALPPRSSGRYCHVYFESHEAATVARRILMPGQVRICDRRITLDWAKSHIPEEVAEQARNPLVSSILAAKQLVAKQLVALQNGVQQQQQQQQPQHQQQHHQRSNYGRQRQAHTNRRRNTNSGASTPRAPRSNSGSSTSLSDSNAATTSSSTYEQNMKFLGALLPHPVTMEPKFCTDWNPSLGQQFRVM